MAKSLQDRLASAKANPRARINDIEQLRADLVSEKESLVSRHQQHSAASINFALADQDRDAAATEAERIVRTLQGIEVEIAVLADLVAERRASERSATLDAEREAATAERDQLAAELPDAYAAASIALVDLAKRIMAIDARMKACGLGTALSAEAMARGCSGLFQINGSYLTRIIEIRLPQFAGTGDLWPVADFNPAATISEAVASIGRREAQSLQQWHGRD